MFLPSASHKIVAVYFVCLVNSESTLLPGWTTWVETVDAQNIPNSAQAVKGSWAVYGTHRTYGHGIIYLHESNHKNQPNQPNVGKHIMYDIYIYGSYGLRYPPENDHISPTMNVLFPFGGNFVIVPWRVFWWYLWLFCYTFGNTQGWYSEASIVIAHLKMFPPKKNNMTFLFLDSLGFKRNRLWSSRTCYPMAVLGHALRCRTSSSRQWIMFGL